jgi:hypothetical protein
MPFKFSENETVTDIDAVDESLRIFYVQGEGDDAAYTLREDMKATAVSWDNVNGANANIRKEIKALKSSKVDLSALAEYGETTAAILETFTGQKKELSDALDKKDGHVNPEKIRKEMAKSHAEALGKSDARADSYKDQLYKLIVTNKALEAIAEHKGDAELLIDMVTKQVRARDEDGELVARVMDEDGEPRIGGAGSLMTVPELVKSMKSEKKYAKLFDADVRSGSNPPARRANGAPPATIDKIPAAQRIERALPGRR